MASSDIDEQFLTYQGRLASFQKSNKKRGSTTAGRGAKALNWPHKSITPASLASAGFFFYPTPENPDNVMCFLCQKSLDGWEAGDDPLEEHLKHAGHCGWAIVAAIEAGIEEYTSRDSSQAAMVEARKETFAKRWPHEGKRGWKCKTKQLADAGWIYTPTPESDDMATCVYCNLGLDGWEQNDKPFDEHHRREPECRFFALSSKHNGTKKSRGKAAARTSKASRLSTQSVATMASETTSIADQTIGAEDSVLTTTSTMTQGEKKGRGKKATSKGRKTKAKKEEPVEEPEELPAPEPIESSPAPQPQPSKAKRGKKRSSAAVEESTLTVVEAPASKRRATKDRTPSIATISIADSSLIGPDDTDMTDAPVSKKGKGGKKARGSSLKPGRKASTASTNFTASVSSVVAPAEEFPDDDEIERQLQADLERQFSEDEIVADSDSERHRASLPKANVKKADSKRTSKAKASSYSMFDPSPQEVDEAEVEDELNALQTEMEVDEPQLQVPKKGRKAGTRTASKETKAGKRIVSKQAKAKQAKPAPIPIDDDLDDLAAPERPSELEKQEDASFGSTDTVVKTSAASPKAEQHRRSSKLSVSFEDSADELDLVEIEPPAKKGRGRPPKASNVSVASGADASKAAPAKRKAGKPSKKAQASQVVQDEIETETQPEVTPVAAATKEKKKSKDFVVIEDESADEQPVLETITSPPQRAIARVKNQLPSTPAKTMSPASSLRHAVLSPSQSPQSSDAENQPPSSKPAMSASTKRIALAPMTATPMRGSPSKRNVFAGLQSATPWTAVDLDAVTGTPRANADKENAMGRLLKQGKELTSPEKEMTVEEWILFNAGEAERKLKHECEVMVSRFESEGTRAMQVLEGLAVE